MPGILSSVLFKNLPVISDFVAAFANSSGVISLPCNSAARDTLIKSCAI